MSTSQTSPKIVSFTNKLLRKHRFALGILAILIGCVVGAASVAFHYLIMGWTWVSTGYFDYSAHPGAKHGYLGIPSYFLIVVPVIAGLIYGPLITKFAPSARGHGVPEVMLAVKQNGGRIPGKVAVIKLLASALTLGSGGSVGREGPIVQVGASLGSWLSSQFGLRKEKIILFAACGSAAGIAATFNAPLAGACFAIEVILGGLSAESFVFIVFSAVGASVVSHLIIGDKHTVELPQNLILNSSKDLVWVALVALIAGLAGLGFSKFLYLCEDGVDAIYKLPESLRPALGGLFLGIGLYFFPMLYGSGNHVQLDVLTYHYSTIWLLLALGIGRMLFTAYTIAIGGSGGVFAPSLFIGATAGMATGLAIQPWSISHAAVYGVIGMGAAFAAAARAPLTAALIIVEMTGQYSLILPMLLAVGIATAMSMFLTRSTIYTQKLLRRGDTLDDPVSKTVLGRMRASELMHETPLQIPVTTPIPEVQALFSKYREASLPAVDENNRFVGSITPLILAETLAEHDPRVRTLQDLQLVHDHVDADDLPARILGVFASTSLFNLPVLDAERQVLGYVRSRDLVDKLYQQQKQAIAAGKGGTSWGLRMKNRWHNRQVLLHQPQIFHPRKKK